MDQSSQMGQQDKLAVQVALAGLHGGCLDALMHDIASANLPTLGVQAKPTAGVSYVVHTESRQHGTGGLPRLPHLGECPRQHELHGALLAL